MEQQRIDDEEKGCVSVGGVGAHTGLILDLFDPALSHDHRIKPAQHHFVNLVLQGMTREAAYRQAFPQHKDSDQRMVWNMASRMLCRPHIKQALELGYQQMRANAVWERWQSIDALAAVVRGRKGLPDTVPAVRELNAMQGYNEATRLEVEFVSSVARRIIDNDESNGA